jgi:nucleoside-diphosphate-sugar epimerase
MNMKKVCIVGASGKLGQYMVQHALDRGYEVVGLCRERREWVNSTRSRGALPSFPERRTTAKSSSRRAQVVTEC